jgi:hypothetical protein
MQGIFKAIKAIPTFLMRRDAWSLDTPNPLSLAMRDPSIAWDMK